MCEGKVLMDKMNCQERQDGIQQLLDVITLGLPMVILGAAVVCLQGQETLNRPS